MWKDQIFQWAEVQQRAFEDIKKAIANTPILAYYDLEKPVTIQTDMPDVGVGAVLLQNWKPVSYASKVWNDYEKNYAPIEKEMRAVVFGLHKFSDYCDERHITIESDHKPLEAISNKPLSEVPKRLLRMVLSIKKFDYKITYKKGSDIIIADALSRAPVEDDNLQFNFSEVNLLEFLAVSEQTRDRLVSATKEDKDLQKLIKLIKQGFPMQYKVLEPQLKHLYKFRTTGMLYQL